MGRNRHIWFGLMAIVIFSLGSRIGWAADYFYTENFADPGNYTLSSNLEITVTDGQARLNNIRDSIVSWWPMNEGSDGTVADTGVGHYNGTLTNGTWVAGKVGPYAVSFNGTNTLMTASPPEPSLPMTFAMWIKPNSDYMQGVLEIGPQLVYGFRIAYNIAQWVYLGASDPLGLPVGEWNHVVVVLRDAGNGYGEIVYYRNGSLVGAYRNTAAGLEIAWSDPIRFGDVELGISGHYDGVLDEPSIWNRELTPAEIAGLYNNGSGWALPTTTYPTNDPCVQPIMSRGAAWTSLIKWTSFSETATKPANTEIKYQFSFNDGVTWHYYGGSGWVAAAGPANANTAGQLTPTVMQAIYPTYPPAVTQKIMWRAFLISTDGVNTPVLSSVTINYQQSEATSWQWGAGAYCAGAPENPEQKDVAVLDSARWDWGALSWSGNGVGFPAVWDDINAQLVMNPDQKFVVDLNFTLMNPEWGNPNGYEGGTITMFEYRYMPGVKDGVDQAIRDRVNFVLNHCVMPENIAGFVLMEEIPIAFGCNDQITCATDPHAMPLIVEEYRTQIEAERGKTLVWDEETKLWVGQVYVEGLHDLHTVLKEAIADTTNHPAAPNAKVCFWDVGHYLDDTYYNDLNTPGWDIWTQYIYPCNLKDILFSETGQRLVDVLWGSSAHTWFINATLWRANKYNTPFVTQLWHPAANRLCTWADTLNYAKTDQPLNLGYFFYCSGSCNNDGSPVEKYDPSFSSDPAENVLLASCADHGRRFGAQENIGMDIVRQELAPSPSANIALSGRSPGTVVPLTVLLENPATPDYFTSAEQAVATGVVLTLTLPDDCVLDPGHPGQSPTWIAGNMAAQSWQKHVWWVKVNAIVTNPVTTADITSTNRPTVTKTFTGDSVIPTFRQHYIRRPEKNWTENAIGEPAIDIAVWFTALETVDHPSLTIGSSTVTYNAGLLPGQRLLYTPWNGQALIFNDMLLPATTVGGDVPYTEGYAVAALNVGRAATGLTQVKTTISGKVAGGCVSRVGLVYLMTAVPPWTYQTVTCLQGKLTTDWSTVSETSLVPAGAKSLYSVWFYRANQIGSVWYGTVKIDNDSVPFGLDVSNDMEGYLPASIAADDFSVVEYGDQNLISKTPKVIAQVVRRAGVNITAPSGGAWYSAPATVNITASAESLNGAVSRVEFYYNDTNLIATDNDGADGWSCTWSNVPAGFYALTAVAYDSAGSTKSAPVNIISGILLPETIVGGDIPYTEGYAVDAIGVYRNVSGITNLKVTSEWSEVNADVAVPYGVNQLYGTVEVKW